MSIPPGLFTWAFNGARRLHQGRRRVRVLVHQAYFTPGPPVPHLFVNVTNLSRDRDIEITHVWFEADPQVHVLCPQRPLPKRLRPDEPWETWVPVGALMNEQAPERLGRVRLSTGRVVKSRPNASVPERGFIPG